MNKKKLIQDDVREVRDWKQDLLYYSKLIAVEVDQEGGYRIIDAMNEPELIGCPVDFFPGSFIFPEAAKEFLPINELECQVVEIRHANSLSDGIQAEVRRRWDSGGANAKPNYYTVRPKDKPATCFRGYVALETARQIAKELGVPVGR
ncbi:MAG: hypothetical protein Q8Q23_02535 [bacterium]|nr:hypothetical protein [bacterium]